MSDMQAAVEQHMKTLEAQGQPRLSEAEAREVQEKAEKLVEGISAEGVKDLQNLYLSMGLPATRALFQQMVTASSAAKAVRQDALRAIAAFSPITEEGCMQLQFFNRPRGRADTAYVRIAQCPRGHNLDLQFAKLRPHMSEKWEAVLHACSVLLHCVRATHAQAVAKHLPLIRSLFDLGADDPCSAYADLRVDNANTTLYLDASWPNRVGILISLESESAQQ